MDGDFTSEQKRYLEGFTSGIQVGRLKPASGAPAAAAAPSGPDAPHIAAQARTETAGKKLVDQEKWKRDEHPFDAYNRLKDQAAKDEFPKPADNFRWRYYGLFYVAPAQDSYMCRLRIHNGILKQWQFAGLADLAEQFAGPYSHVTTRANLQLREIPARNGIEVIERIIDLGLCSKGSGADNIRNVTGDATAGIAPDELLDTRPYAREWHYAILNDRTMYGLPRKFNVAFDGGGPIPTLEDTNDIGFQAVAVGEGAGIEPGIYFRLVLGGISGHKDLARDTGVVLKPAEASKVAEAIVKVFVDTGDRTNRNKARLKYVLDEWGFAKFLESVEAKLGRKLLRVDPAHVAPRPAQDRLAHVGVHPQQQDGLVLRRRGAARRQDGGGADARTRGDLARPRRRRHPPDRLAEPADLRHARSQARRGQGADRGGWAGVARLQRAGRACRLHGRAGLQVRGGDRPRRTPKNSPPIWSRGSRSTRRSTST